jgi:hypothetical protein
MRGIDPGTGAALWGNLSAEIGNQEVWLETGFLERHFSTALVRS